MSRRSTRRRRRGELRCASVNEPKLRCWCGVVDPYFAPIRGGCGGLGSLDCFCGGDLCVCHNHGEVECFGCDDCESDDRYDDLEPEYPDDL